MRAPRTFPPAHVGLEEINPDWQMSSPYRGIVTTGGSILRLRVMVAPRNVAPYKVVIEVDDVSLVIRQGGAEIVRSSGELVVAPGDVVLSAGEISALFVVERQPRHGFLTWYGVFVRGRGRSDHLVLETPEGEVAQFVERAIEDRLGLGDEPVRGELRHVL